MPFFTYLQNNSGGHYIVNDKVAHCVIIEARNSEQANETAEEVGIYFDEDCVIDCPTCGSRWDYCYGDGTDRPDIYGRTIDAALQDPDSYLCHVQAIVHVYYMNGNHGVLTAQSFSVTATEKEPEDLPEIGAWFTAALKS